MEVVLLFTEEVSILIITSWLTEIHEDISTSIKEGVKGSN